MFALQPLLGGRARASPSSTAANANSATIAGADADGEVDGPAQLALPRASSQSRRLIAQLLRGGAQFVGQSFP